MAAASQGSTPCWVWSAAEIGATTRPLRHPAEVPAAGDEVGAKACFLQALRGPRQARISPALRGQATGGLVVVLENGVTREVPLTMVLPWYEGLLLLEEAELSKGQAGRIPAPWWGNELKAVLDREREKTGTSRLNATRYTEEKLLKVAATGTCFVDGQDKRWQLRRWPLANGGANLEPGENGNGCFRVAEITDYLPPWEAFHHEKCGFYQDFYQVQWGYPYSRVDYKSVENGSAGQTGATWEPDECLPAHLDPLRVRAKMSWIQRRRQQELRELERRQEEERRQALEASPSLPSSAAGPAGAAGAAATTAAAVAKRERVEEAPQEPGRKLARTRRDGLALSQDLFHARIGHDFAPGGFEQTCGHVRTGWPKKAEEYPEGFAVASPPGFCWRECDCMDDQRPQRSWETTKGWLENPTRAAVAAAAVKLFGEQGEQSKFLRCRGQTSKQFFFESTQGAFGDKAQAIAALKLSHAVQLALQAVLQQIPPCALSCSTPDPVRIPARAFLADDADYEPFQFALACRGGKPPSPEWARIDADTGQLSLSRPPSASELPQTLQVELVLAEGVKASATCRVIADSLAKPLALWTVPLAQSIAEASCSGLGMGVLGVLREHVAEVFDFVGGTPLPSSLGKWLDVMGRVLRLLRCAAGTQLVLRPPPDTAPMTPPG